MEHHSTVFKTLDLPGGTLVPFSSTRGERVRVLSGRVWLTEEGDLGDAVLATGEEVALGGHGLAVIEALTPARVQLLESQNLWSAAKKGARRTAAMAERIVAETVAPADRGVEESSASAGACTIRR